MNETRQLADWAASLTFDAIPSEVVEAARIYVLDDLASGFVGAKLPWTRIVSDLAFESSTGPCSVFASTRTTSPSAAALINGVAIGGFETDHPFSVGNCHPSGAVFPAVLAGSEVSHVDGRAFLSAIVAGYEALCRIGLAATRAVEDERGFHGPGRTRRWEAPSGRARRLG
jgi:2-methylcitrate dehydratase PrpD